MVSIEIENLLKCFSIYAKKHFKRSQYQQVVLWQRDRTSIGLDEVLPLFFHDNQLKHSTTLENIFRIVFKKSGRSILGKYNNTVIDDGVLSFKWSNFLEEKPKYKHIYEFTLKISKIVDINVLCKYLDQLALINKIKDNESDDLDMGILKSLLHHIIDSHPELLQFVLVDNIPLNEEWDGYKNAMHHIISRVECKGMMIGCAIAVLDAGADCSYVDKQGNNILSLLAKRWSQLYKNSNEKATLPGTFMTLDGLIKLLNLCLNYGAVLNENVTTALDTIYQKHGIPLQIQTTEDNKTQIVCPEKTAQRLTCAPIGKSGIFSLKKEPILKDNSEDPFNSFTDTLN